MDMRDVHQEAAQGPAQPSLNREDNPWGGCWEPRDWKNQLQKTVINDYFQLFHASVWKIPSAHPKTDGNAEIMHHGGQQEGLFFSYTVLQEFASSAPGRENHSDNSSGIKTHHNVPRFSWGVWAGVLNSSLHLSRSFLCSKALIAKRKKSQSSEKTQENAWLIKLI